MAGTKVTAPGQAATVSATQITTSMPSPMGARARDSSPKGIKRKAATAQGMIHSAVTGTATKLAARPKTAKRLK